MQRLAAAMQSRGRDVADLDIALFGAPMDPAQCAGRIEQGFDHIVFGAPPADADTVLPHLDRVAEVVAAIRGQAPA